MAVEAGLADAVLVTLGWNGYSALRPTPDARPTKRTMNLGPMGETVRNFYAPNGQLSDAQHYSLYLRSYVETYGRSEERRVGTEGGIACRTRLEKYTEKKDELTQINK